LKDAPKADVIYQITEADKDVNIRECKVTLVSVSFTENGYRVWNNQDIKKRCTQKDIDKLLEFFDRIKKADREIYYRTEWDGKYGKCSHSVKLSEIDNKNVSFFVHLYRKAVLKRNKMNYPGSNVSLMYAIRRNHKSCGCCTRFKHEDAYGNGWCSKLNVAKECGDWCEGKFFIKKKTLRLI
jgi:hypothetical protein